MGKFCGARALGLEPGARDSLKWNCLAWAFWQQSDAVEALSVRAYRVGEEDDCVGGRGGAAYIGPVCST